jgi:hypothetical protein
MRRRGCIGCLVPFVLLVAGAVGFLLWSGSSLTLHYRFTLVVDDDGKEVSGSAVYETQWAGVAEYFPSLSGLAGGPWHPVYSGEATYVDLGNPAFFSRS